MADLQDDAVVCVTCGARFSGRFCSRCGEQPVAERDLSLRGFLVHTFQTFTSLDNRTTRSLRHLLFRPGFLTAEYVRGRRQLYLSPVQLFLVANLLFFIAAAVPFLPLITLDTPLNVHLYNSNYQEFARDMVRNRFAAQDSVDFAAFRSEFNYVAKQYAKSLFIVLVPCFAVVLAILRIRQREPAGKHLVFALHMLGFVLLLFVGVSAVILAVRLGSGGALLQGDSIAIPIGVVSLLVLYLVPAFRRAYGSRSITAVVQAVILAAAFVPAIVLYRLILFLLVFLSV